MTLKTRSGVKKRVKITGTGKIKLSKAWKRHLLSDKSKKSKGRNKYGLIVSNTETKKIKQQLPHM
ncbi:MAG: 50S ribosomal protein L35 [Candidatus Gracilibacteria bacterium]|nr:50S ribosomal protein L35 [Candidatus Gracilibacteria bacterium]